MDNTHTLKSEELFHDKWAESIDVDKIMVDEFFEACTSSENRFIIRKLGDIRGKKILELGCGAGEASVYFSKKGGDVVATDISNGMLGIVKKVAQRHNVSLQTRQICSHKIDFDDETFDMVYAANLLHHVDIESAVKEAHRVLKRGGVFVSWDPLAYNPLINIYRKMATNVRTTDEHPIKTSDLKIFRKTFSVVEFDTTWLFSLLVFVKYYLIDRVDPNKERYWKKILIEHKKLEYLYTKLEKVDRIAMKCFPFLRRFCWNIIIFARK